MAAAPGRRTLLAPLVLATMASQALLVVLAPTLVATAADFGASVGAVGQARSITAGVAIAASVAIASRLQRIGVAGMVRRAGALAIVASLAVAVSPALAVYLAAHVLTGAAFAGLLTAGFAGAAAFVEGERSWALGHIAGANG